ncbi:MAG: YqaA family protein [Caulobacterales bacterium]
MESTSTDLPADGAPPEKQKPTMSQRLVAVARGPNAEKVLAAVSFAESSFFPLPPDLMLAPMAAARPERAFRYAFICTLASVIGGLAGYAIGHFFADTVGKALIELYGYQDKLKGVEAAYAQWGIWIILIKGFTPIPFKLITIASGLLHYSLPMFIFGSVLTRGARFFLVAWGSKTYGPQVLEAIEKRLLLVGGITVAVIVAALILLPKIMH